MIFTYGFILAFFGWAILPRTKYASQPLKMCAVFLIASGASCIAVSLLTIAWYSLP